MARRLLSLVALGACLCTVGAGLGHSAPGWTLNIRYTTDVESLDPAFAFSGGAQSLLWLTCETLTRYPDAAGSLAAQPVPGAAGAPQISADGRTYTFTIRRGLRFDDGSPLTAANFAAAINRVLDPQMGSDFAGLYLSDVVGAQAVMDGKATAAKGIAAHGQVLTIRLTQPAPDLLTRIALPPFCPVPVNLAHDPAGVDFVPSTGPYRIASRVVDQRIVLVRNPYYHGSRPRTPARIVVTIGGTDDSDVAAVEQGTADFATEVGGLGGPVLDTPTLQRLVSRYGVNRGRFFFEPTLGVNMFVLNTAHGIFARNPSLRRAVNFAVDRHALAATFGYLGVKRAFQMLPPGVPGHVDSHLYPVRGPDFARARALAKGHLAGGKAVMYAPDSPAYHQRGEILAYDLGQIGIRVQIKYIPRGLYYGEVGDNPKGYDIAVFGWSANYDDPDFFLPFFLGSNQIGNTNLSLFHDPTLDREMTAAARLPAPERYTAFGKLDIAVMRDLAPIVPYANPAAYFLVSKRIGCVTYSPIFVLDYATLCLRK